MDRRDALHGQIKTVGRLGKASREQEAGQESQNEVFGGFHRIIHRCAFHNFSKFLR